MNNLEEFEIAYNKYTGRDTSAPVERLKHPVPGITYKYQYANDMLAFWNAARAGLIAQLEAAQKEISELREEEQEWLSLADIHEHLNHQNNLNVEHRNKIHDLKEKLAKAEAALSAANEKLSKPVVLSSSTVMSRAYVVQAIKAAGFTVEGE
ncbi:TPA: hypothetical protein PXP85_004432 [Yersinia enterocolitica]|nr:hypothetical protein [Yersinia enterocolitica]